MRLVCVTFLLFLLSVPTIGQEVTVFSGFWGPEFYQDDKEITKQEFKSLLAMNDEAKGYWKKTETNAALGGISVLAQFGFAVWTGIEIGQDDGDATVPAIGTIGFGILGALFLAKANQNGKKAILTYNKQFDDRRTSFRLVPVGNGNGVGLALKF